MSGSTAMGALSHCYVPLAATTSSDRPKQESLAERQQRLVASRSTGEEDGGKPAAASARGSAAMRRLCLETSVVRTDDGSALVELGHTKVLAQVVGPLTDPPQLNMDRGTLLCQVQYAPHVGLRTESVVGAAVTTLDSQQLSQGKVSSIRSTREADLSSRLHAALHPAVPLDHCPKCVWSVGVTVLQDDGSVLSAAIVASSLALADAHVELYDLVSSCSVAVFASMATATNTDATNKHCTTLLADPTEEELAAADATVVLAVMPSWKDVTLWQQTGKLSAAEAAQAVDLCRDGCRTLQRFMRHCLLQHVESS